MVEYYIQSNFTSLYERPTALADFLANHLRFTGSIQQNGKPFILHIIKGGNVMTKENVKETVGKETKGGSKELLVGTLVGSVVGVTTALLVAPKSGKELRASIQDGANQALAKTGQVKETVYAKGQDLKQRTARLSQKSPNNLRKLSTK